MLQLSIGAPLKKIIHLSPGNVFFKDLKGVYRIVNLNYANYLNKTTAEIVGKTDFELFDSDTAQELRNADDIAIQKGAEFEVEETDRRTGKIYLSKKIPLYNDDNKPIGIYGISFDITERKVQEKVLAEALERADAANKAKTAFISSVSHDMRTPLTAILGALELIEMQAITTSKTEELFAVAKKCGQTLINMINRVMDFAQREYIGLDINKKNVNLRQLAIDCKDMYELAAQKKGIKLNFDYQAPELFYTDYHCTQEILLNLIGNAVKFTEEGEVNIKINGTNKAIKILVQDTGIGIPADMHEAVFERFTRVERSDQSKYPGHGLGLAKVKSSIDALEGKVLLMSEPGKGASFEVYIGV